MKELQGKWNYQSFCSFAAVADRSAGPNAPPTVMRPALITGPWTPPSVMEFATDLAGKVTGSAELGPLKFMITGARHLPLLELQIELPTHCQKASIWSLP